MWFLFAVATAGLESVKDLLSKKNSKETNEYVSAFFYQFIALIFLFVYLIFDGIPEVKLIYWVAFGINAIFHPIWNILYMKSVKLTDLSISLPMLAFTPVLIGIFSFLVDGESPTFYGWLGIVFVTFGVYISKLKKLEVWADLLEPIANIAKDKGTLYMFGVAVIWASGSLIGKIGVVNSSPAFSGFMITFFSSAMLFFVALKKGAFTNKINMEELKNLTLLGLMNGVSKLTLRYALSFGKTSYVSATKRTSILMSSGVESVIYKTKISKIQILSFIIIFVGISCLVI